MRTTTFGTVKLLKYLTRKLIAPKIKYVESLRTRIQVVVLPCETVDSKAKAKADHFSSVGRRDGSQRDTDVYIHRLTPSQPLSTTNRSLARNTLATHLDSIDVSL